MTEQLIIAEQIDIAYFEKEFDELRQNSIDDLREALTGAIQRLIERDRVRGFMLISLADPTVDIEPLIGDHGFTSSATYYVERTAAVQSPLEGLVFAPEAATLAATSSDTEHEYYLPLSVEQVVESLVTEEAGNSDGSSFDELVDWLDALGRPKLKEKSKKARKD